MHLQLDDHVAVVTGASKGIGLAVVRTLLDEGARVVAVSRRGSDALDALAGERLVHVAADVRDPAACGHAMATAVEAFGGLDVLVNNAGGAPDGVSLPRGSFLDAGDEDWQAVFDLNLFSAVRATRAALPLLLERGGGSIVNVSTGAWRRPSAGTIDYGAAKAGLSSMTKALSEEFAPQGVRVNSVAPGPVVTPWWTDEGGAGDVLGAMAGVGREDAVATVGPQLMQLTTGRFARPQEIADVVVLLASPRSASTTGAELVVDSGYLKEL